MRSFFTFFILGLIPEILHAAYYDTLPANIFNFTYRYIHTGAIDNSFNNSGSTSPYQFSSTINADVIKGLNPAVDIYLNSLTPEEYSRFSFGAFSGSAQSKVEAQVMALGYGLTDKLTVYGYVPFFKALVDVKMTRTNQGRTDVGDAIVLENLPQLNDQLIQSVFVNYYHYKPLGKWLAEDFGDTELGLMYQVFKNDYAGALLNTGAVVPTGRTDDPDTLQDFAFGDGQWDAYIEGGGTVHMGSDLSLSQWNRYTYQFSHQEEKRVANSLNLPLSNKKERIKIKLGNKWQSNVMLEYDFSLPVKTSLTYTFDHSGASRVNSVEENKSEKISHTARYAISFSTVEIYRRDNFFLPAIMSIAFQSVVAGKNVPQYNRAEFEVKLFF